jgi:phosphoadenosine phosphosulfate reductase
MEWIQSYFELKNDFMENHALGSMMFSMFRRFLRDAELLENNQFSKTAQILDKIGLSSPTFWGILLVNLSYAPEVGWFIRNVEVDSDVSRSDLIAMLKDAGCSDRGTKSVTGAYKRILTLPFGDLVGLGSVLMDGKTYQGIHRGHWFDPVPEVILYSLYKFAEACGDYYQFSLETLLDDSIERDGVSPTRIFGLDRDTMVRILNGLSINYPEFISASFTLDLDNITLRNDKTAEDVLQLL